MIFSSDLLNSFLHVNTIFTTAADITADCFIRYEKVDFRLWMSASFENIECLYIIFQRLFQMIFVRVFTLSWLRRTWLQSGVHQPYSMFRTIWSTAISHR